MPSIRSAVITAVSTAALLLFPHWATADERPYVAGELLVRYKYAPSAFTRGLLHRAAGVEQSQPIGNSPIHRIVLDENTTVEEAMAVYADDPAVEFAEPNYILTAQTTPDDPSYSLQWGLHNIGQVVSGYIGALGADIDAQNAWDITTGDASILVAVVDTGCDLNHPDLVDNIWSNPNEVPGNGIDDDGNGWIDDIHGWDFMDNDHTPQDAAGHGTHVAGIIAASSDNNRGVSGAAWNVQLLPLRFMNAFSQGTTSDAIRAINYALSMGARIINCSWGGSGYSASLYHTMANADALFVCAAGNSGEDLESASFYPAGFDADNVLSVAASDQNDRLCWFSNHSATAVDVAAPGIRIFSLENGRQTLISETFDEGNLEDMEGWTTGGSGNTWEIGGPPGYGSLTTLALEPDGAYENDADTWVQAPQLDLSNAAGTVLTFRLIGSSQESSDVLYLDVSTDASTWSTPPLKVGSSTRYNGISGTVPHFTTVSTDLGQWDGAPRFHLRFRFQSDADTNADGFYIDDIVLQAAGEQDSYQYMQGTSMAAGFVTGIAALIQSENDTMTPSQIRTLIEDSADRIDDLMDVTVTGGRVNAHQALALQNGSSLPDSSLEGASSGGGGGGGGCFISSIRTGP